MSAEDVANLFLAPILQPLAKGLKDVSWVTEQVTNFVQESITEISELTTEFILDRLDNAEGVGGNLKNYLINMVGKALPDYEDTSMLITNDPIYMAGVKEHFSIGLGKIGLEMGSVPIEFGKTDLHYGLPFVSRPIRVPVGIKVKTFRLPLPNGDIRNYEIRKRLKLKRIVDFGTIRLKTPAFSVGPYNHGGFTLFSFNIKDHIFKNGITLGFDKTVALNIPFLDYFTVPIPIPFPIIPLGRGEPDRITLLSLCKKFKFPFSSDPIDLRYVSIGRIEDWWRRPRWPLSNTITHRYSTPDFIIPDIDQIESLVEKTVTKQLSLRDSSIVR